jgi:hypothetical protein
MTPHLQHIIHWGLFDQYSMASFTQAAPGLIPSFSMASYDSVDGRAKKQVLRTQEIIDHFSEAHPGIFNQLRGFTNGFSVPQPLRESIEQAITVWGREVPASPLTLTTDKRNHTFFQGILAAEQIDALTDATLFRAILNTHQRIQGKKYDYAAIEKYYRPTIVEYPVRYADDWYTLTTYLSFRNRDHVIGQLLKALPQPLRPATDLGYLFHSNEYYNGYEPYYTRLYACLFRQYIMVNYWLYHLEALHPYESLNLIIRMLTANDRVYNPNAAFLPLHSREKIKTPLTLAQLMMAIVEQLMNRLTSKYGIDTAPVFDNSPENNGKLLANALFNKLVVVQKHCLTDLTLITL